MVNLLPNFSMASITSAFISFKAIQILLVSLTPAQFDTSSQLLFASPAIQSQKQHFLSFFPSFLNSLHVSSFITGLLERLVAWDAVYFTKLFAEGIDYEHEFVFGPLWWRVVHYASRAANGVNGDGKINFYVAAAVAVTLANLCNYLSIIVLYHWTLLMGKSRRFASICSMLYVFNPAGAFLLAPYSEPLATLAAFVSFYCREKAISRLSYTRLTWSAISGLALSVGIMTRSNLVLCGYIYVYDLLRSRSAKSAFRALVGGIFALMGVVFAAYLPSLSLCPQRDWCKNGFYSFLPFAQAHYWNVGLFKYWTLNNVPNFLLVAPMVMILCRCCWRLRQQQYAPFVHVTVLFLVMGVSSWHVQILTRISGFLALPYWYVAEMIENGGAEKDIWLKIIVGWFVGYSMVQTVLYAAFLPPA